MPEPLPRLLSALRTAVPGLDGTALAEALWLAAHRAAGTDGAAPRPAGDDTDAGRDRPGEAPEPATTSTPDDPAPPPTAPQPPRAADDTAATRPLHERLPGSATPVPGRAVAAPHTGGLPRALELTRALRPWKRRWPEGRGSTLDIDATVDGYARSGELIPVLRPAPERWFDLVLVVDRSPGMRVWAETVAEFTAVLDRLGAFRTLQVTDLTFGADGEPHAPGPLRAADGRRLVVLVSDCMAGAWRRPEVWHLLRRWASAQPTALLNPLPTKLWRHGGLNLPTTRFTPAAPGTHRSRVPVEPPLTAPGSRTAEADGDWLPVPVLSLTPHALGRWSDTLMRGDPEGCTAVLVPPTGRPATGPARAPAAPLPPAELTRRFLRTASPRAARLTVLCAPFDRLSLRLLHLVRARLVPDATVADVAEAVTSGVFGITEDGGGTVELTLPPEAREVLREHLPAHEVWALHQALDDHIADRGAGRARLPSVAYDGQGPRTLAAEQEAFARASRRTLELLGLAEPETAPDPQPADDPDAAPPRGTAHLPPAPEPYVGHDALVGRVVSALSDAEGPRVVRITAGDPAFASAGRTALALTVAHRMRGHYADGAFFVPFGSSGARPEPVTSVLYGLLDELGALPRVPDDDPVDGPDGYVRAVLDALRDRRVLLVLDDVDDETVFAPLVAGLPDGCGLLVTSRGTSVTDPSAATTVDVPPLTGEDASHLLRASGASTGEPVASGAWSPLALRILGAAMGSAEPYVADAAARFAAGQRGVGDPTQLVRQWLDEGLDGGRAPALIRLAEVTYGEFTFDEACAVLPGHPAATRRTLDELVRQGLLDHARGGRYAFPAVVGDEVAGVDGHEARRERARDDIGRFYREAAVVRYRERHPDSVLPSLLGIPPSPATGYDVRVANALGLWGLDTETLLLLVPDAASPPYRKTFVRAVIHRMATQAERPGPAAVRGTYALARFRHDTGSTANARELLLDLAAGVRQTDERLYGPICLLQAQLDLADDPSRPQEAVRWASAALRGLESVEGVEATRSSEYRDALRCREEALALMDDHTERLATQQRLLAALPRTHTVERARVHLRTADTYARLSRPQAALAEAEQALALLGPDDDPATRDEARGLIRALSEPSAPPAPPAPSVPRERVVIALQAASPDSRPGRAVTALLAELDDVGPHRFTSHPFGDELVLLVDGSVPLPRLVRALAERLPSRLERGAVRFAVHRGPMDGTDPATDVAVEYTRTMLRSAEFGKARANYPDDVVLCASPEAYADLAAGEDEDAPVREFTAREVRSASGEVVCVVLTPPVDLSAYDTELLGLARVFNEIDPEGRTLAGILRDALDTVLDPRATGRFDPEELTDRERLRVADEIARALDAGVAPFRLRRTEDRTGSPAGGLTWQRPQGAVPFAVVVSPGAGRPLTAPAGLPDGALSLLLYADDARARWSAGLVRGRGDQTPAAGAVVWLHRDAPLPENVLLTLAPEDRRSVLSGPDDVGRVAELFRRVPFRPVPATALRPLVHDRLGDRVLDPVIRRAGAALREDGVLLLTGNARGRAMAEALRLPVPRTGTYVSAPLALRRSAHGARPSVTVDGTAWVVAREDDVRTPLPSGFPSLRVRRDARPSDREGGARRE
ncbi:NaeI family type II restriction endonuclease [Streptomyces roseicoloratus]|uniref:NaeI family type II restriction endonuclease n=1 Tax=Streptomyces roseicoloratus TaxID=2508722 RepID=A0ABY9RQD5_9ACTN|nr:NaeI family type II restriction endonuclease [Streptomyces roseicoloratus]WMX43958.1 NaeI family type II restriction endonuclease [Streptomyces roseicoloratus]